MYAIMLIIGVFQLVEFGCVRDDQLSKLISKEINKLIVTFVYVFFRFFMFRVLMCKLSCRYAPMFLFYLVIGAL